MGRAHPHNGASRPRQQPKLHPRRRHAQAAISVGIGTCGKTVPRHAQKTWAQSSKAAKPIGDQLLEMTPLGRERFSPCLRTTIASACQMADQQFTDFAGRAAVPSVSIRRQYQPPPGDLEPSLPSAARYGHDVRHVPRLPCCCKQCQPSPSGRPNP